MNPAICRKNVSQEDLPHGAYASESRRVQGEPFSPTAPGDPSGLCDTAPGVVYAIQAEYGGPVKIGFVAREESLPQRLSSLQTGNPYPLRVVWQIRRPRSFEKHLHALFADARLVGEWFDPTPELVMLTGAKDGDLMVEFATRAYDLGWERGFDDGHPCEKCELTLCECPPTAASKRRDEKIARYEADALWGRGSFKNPRALTAGSGSTTSTACPRCGRTDYPHVCFPLTSSESA